MSGASTEARPIGDGAGRGLAYGQSPFPLTLAESRGVHGNDERVSLDALMLGHFLYDIVQRVARR